MESNTGRNKTRLTGFDIDPITFNGDTYARVELAMAAQKHFGEDSEKYFRYIMAGIDGASWMPMEIGKRGEPIYHAASATSIVKESFAESDYRKTVFAAFPESGTIYIYHSSSIKRKQYNRLVEEIERKRKKNMKQ